MLIHFQLASSPVLLQGRGTTKPAHHTLLAFKALLCKSLRLAACVCTSKWDQEQDKTTGRSTLCRVKNCQVLNSTLLLPRSPESGATQLLSLKLWEVGRGSVLTRPPIQPFVELLIRTVLAAWNLGPCKIDASSGVAFWLDKNQMPCTRGNPHPSWKDTAGEPCLASRRRRCFRRQGFPAARILSKESVPPFCSFPPALSPCHRFSESGSLRLPAFAITKRTCISACFRGRSGSTIPWLWEDSNRMLLIQLARTCTSKQGS